MQTQCFPFIGATLPRVANLSRGAACEFHLGLVFIVSLSTCDCWYVNGTFFIGTGEP